MSKNDKPVTAPAAAAQTAVKDFSQHVGEVLAKEPVKAQRGLPADIQNLAKLDKILRNMPPEEALRCMEWLEPKYGAAARYEANGEAP